LEHALAADRLDLLALTRPAGGEVPSSVPVPETLAHYQVEVARITDYDSLLTGGIR